MKKDYVPAADYAVRFVRFMRLEVRAMNKDILLCGVGGQGTVLASKLIASAAMRCGNVVHSAETIGMAQRGGSVISHIRIGERAASPLIPRGNADILLHLSRQRQFGIFPT